MLDEIMEVLSIDENITIEFREICGFTFAFEIKIITIKDKLTSGQIRPVAIIYDENDDFYLAPLDDAVNIDLIVKNFVKKSLCKK